jgi:hypothetical protein
MHPYLKIALWIGIVVALFMIFPALLVIALLILLWWLISNLTEHGPKWIWWQRDALFLRLGRFRWFGRLPWVSGTLRRVQAEDERRKVEARRKQAEADAREQAERDKAQKEHDALVERPIPPDIQRDMRAFLDGSFVGEDRSPLAYVGYRVGKTRGLPSRERQRRLDACFRIEIPSDLDPKYQGWGAPATYQRFRSIEKHLKMLADMRSGRSNQRFAVADWEEDRMWFQGKFQELAGLLQRHPPRRYW